jgi:hypothetical protein
VFISKKKGGGQKMPYQIYLRPTYPNELYHHGIKGQKWGVRRFQNPDGSLTEAGKKRYEVSDTKPSFRTRHNAKKDAKEFARAKMFYGEGAGNRRKLIKGVVEERSKDPYYKEQFDKYLERQDMAKHAQKAEHERHRKDTVKNVSKTARGMYHLSVGDAARVGMSAAVIYGVLHATGTDEKLKDFAKTNLSSVSNKTLDYVKRKKFEYQWRNVKIV